MNVFRYLRMTHLSRKQFAFNRRYAMRYVEETVSSDNMWKWVSADLLEGTPIDKRNRGIYMDAIICETYIMGMVRIPIKSFAEMAKHAAPHVKFNCAESLYSMYKLRLHMHKVASIEGIDRYFVENMTVCGYAFPRFYWIKEVSVCCLKYLFGVKINNNF